MNRGDRKTISDTAAFRQLGAQEALAEDDCTCT